MKKVIRIIDHFIGKHISTFFSPSCCRTKNLESIHNYTQALIQGVSAELYSRVHTASYQINFKREPYFCSKFLICTDFELFESIESI